MSLRTQGQGLGGLSNQGLQGRCRGAEAQSVVNRKPRLRGRCPEDEPIRRRGPECRPIRAQGPERRPIRSGEGALQSRVHRSPAAPAPVRTCPARPLLVQSSTVSAARVAQPRAGRRESPERGREMVSARVRPEPGEAASNRPEPAGGGPGPGGPAPGGPDPSLCPRPGVGSQRPAPPPVPGPEPCPPLGGGSREGGRTPAQTVKGSGQEGGG